VTTESIRIRKNLSSGQRLILLIYLILFIPLFRPIVDGLDPVGYYAWARSVLIDHDLNVANEFDHYGILEHMASLTNGKLTPTGYFHNQFAAGSALLWLPAMTVAHLIARLAQSLGLSVQADGHSIVYTWWQTAETQLRFRGGMLRGLAAGLALWVRTQNAILLVALLGEAAFDILVAWRHDGLGTALKNHLPILAGLAVGYCAWLLPLMVFWRVVFGAWVVNTYRAVNPPLDWRAPHAIDILISTDRGMFTWSPITLPALIG
jgi:hypothetical protein